MTPSMNALIRRPIAWLPFLLSASALALIVGYLVAAGPVTPGSGEEGAPARLFQLILLAELAAIGMFAVRWLPEAPRPASRILAAQVVLAALPIVLITVLEASARG